MAKAAESDQLRQALDAALIAAQQSVEHYEISRYGTLRTWAAQFGMKNAVKLLE